MGTEDRIGKAGNLARKLHLGKRKSNLYSSISLVSLEMRTTSFYPEAPLSMLSSLASQDSLYWKAKTTLYLPLMNDSPLLEKQLMSFLSSIRFSRDLSYFSFSFFGFLLIPCRFSSFLLSRSKFNTFHSRTCQFSTLPLQGSSLSVPPLIGHSIPLT